MNLDGWVSSLKDKWVAPPEEFRHPEAVQELLNLGLQALRQDMNRAKKIGSAALSLGKFIRHKPSQGLAQRLIGHTFLLEGRFRKALSHYERALVSLGDNAQERAATTMAMLNCLAYLGKYERAFDLGRESIDTFLASGEVLKAARVRQNMANALHRLDRLSEAKHEYELALTVMAEERSEGDIAICLRNYAVCLMGLQEFDQAEALYDRARQIFEESNDRNLLHEIDANVAYLYGRRGLIREALVRYRSLRSEISEDAQFEIGNAALDEADFMVEIGLYRDAIIASTKAVEIFERLSSPLEQGKSHLLRGLAHVRLGSTIQALADLRIAKRRLNREKNRTWLALAEQAMAECASSQGKPRQALKALLRAERLGPAPERLPGIQRLLVHNSVLLGLSDEAEARLADSHFPDLEAVFLASQGEHRRAEEKAKEALAAYDLSRKRVGGNRLRRAIAQASSAVLTNCFGCLRDPEDRLAVVARLKNQALAEGMTSPEASPSDSEARLLRLRLHTLGESDREGAESELTQRLAETLNLLEPEHIAELTLPTPGSHQRFIEFFVHEGQFLAFVIDKEGVKEIPLGQESEFVNQARFLRLHLGRDSAQGTALALQVLRKLGQLLEPVLVDHPAQIIFGPDGCLNSLPLHAIERHGKALFEVAEVTYAPNAGSWAAALKRPANRGTGCLITGQSDNLAPMIADELDRVSELLKTPLWADEAQLDQAMPRCRLIHMAAHGVIREDRPLFSAMKLGSRDWSVFDILQLRFSADQVTLSGCSTALGNLRDTLDAQGFIEALLSSGAKSVLASFWNVSDASTTDWMTSYYSALSTQNPAEAFRTACLAAREKWPHPLHWAAFGLFGAPDENFSIF